MSTAAAISRRTSLSRPAQKPRSSCSSACRVDADMDGERGIEAERRRDEVEGRPDRERRACRQDESRASRQRWRSLRTAGSALDREPMVRKRVVAKAALLREMEAASSSEATGRRSISRR